MNIIINGGGKVGSHLASKMNDIGHSVTLIEKNEVEITQLSKELPSSVTLILGDGCDSAIQIDAGAERADVFVSATGHDDDNLVACEIASTINGIPRVVARVNNPKNERIFRRVGIESVSATTIITRMIEEETLAGTIQAISTFRSFNVEMFTVKVGGNLASNARMSKRIADIALPQGSLITAIKHPDYLEIVNQDTLLHQGDEIMVISENESIEEAKRILSRPW